MSRTNQKGGRADELSLSPLRPLPGTLGKTTFRDQLHCCSWEQKAAHLGKQGRGSSERESQGTRHPFLQASGSQTLRAGLSHCKCLQGQGSGSDTTPMIVLLTGAAGAVIDLPFTAPGFPAITSLGSHASQKAMTGKHVQPLA